MYILLKTKARPPERKRGYSSLCIRYMGFLSALLSRKDSCNEQSVQKGAFMQDLYRRLRKELMARLALAGEVTDKQIREIITELVIDAGKERYMTLEERSDISKELFYSVRKLDVLQDLIDDRQVTEIMVNGPECIFVERAGRLTRVKSRFSSPEKLDDVIQQIVGKVNRVVNESSPIVDARLPDGSRVNVVTAPVALEGPILTIRRFPEVPITMDKLISYGSITGEAAAFLETLVMSGYSIIVGGGTSAGKTTFLNALSNYIPKTERIITIEDNAELQIQGVPNLVRMEAKQANMEGNAEITIRDLIKSSLRMRPDRIIVGEVRGGEAVDMLQAFNTGHLGFPSCLRYLHRRNHFQSAVLLQLPALI